MLGLNPQDILAMAAAFYSAKVPNADIDWEKAAKLMGSKSIAGARERVRIAKKKAEGQDGREGHTKTSLSNAPVGGVDKKSVGKVKNDTPRKATKVRNASIDIKLEDNDKPSYVMHDEEI